MIGFIKDLLLILLVVLSPFLILIIKNVIDDVFFPTLKGKIDHDLIARDAGRISNKEYKKRLNKGYYHYDSGKYKKLL